ncbi:DUF1289 domain-containing protein [Coralliovum pocilloporae]|uniref:DUF1289 domain-containing protein n=1 Tax=Coralliovum pocilloporae TaxID=3066369 RepID=UPI003306C8E7
MTEDSIGNSSATDEVWKRNEPDSPCEKICMIHPAAGLCIGCHRTAEEIANWARYSQEDRLTRKAELPSRADQLKGHAPARRRERVRRRTRSS